MLNCNLNPRAELIAAKRARLGVVSQPAVVLRLADQIKAELDR